MSEVQYRPSVLSGCVALPPSKSAAHRAILCAALSGEDCRVEHIDLSEDMHATLNAVQALGCAVETENGTVHFSKAVPDIGNRTGATVCEIDCCESGSTLRFLIPIAAALGRRVRFTGRGRLPRRPLGIYEKLLPEHGVAVRTEGGLPLELEGLLSGGTFRLRGDVSSQFITGLLFALPLLREDSCIELTSPLESEGYVGLTVSMLSTFGIHTEKRENGWFVPGNQKYVAHSCRVEGDWSQAAFFLCMAALNPRGGTLELANLAVDSLQGDRACAELFERFGLRTEYRDGVLRAWNPRAGEEFGGLQGISIDAAQIPDMVPALSVCAACARGETRIFHAERLRLKESDRLRSMAEALTALGGNVRETEDGLLIRGVPRLSGGKAAGENDHRVVMALAAAALRSQEPVVVTDAQSINKSYPGFFRDYQGLGGIADVIDLG